MKKWNGRESDYEKAERKESEMGIYEERLQEVSIYGERSSEISSGRSCHLRSSRLSVLSEPAGTAVYASPAGTFSKIQKKKCIVRQKRNLNYQFRDALTSMNVAVQAGYSAENAVRATVKDLARLYEKGSDILDEFRYIESQLRLSVPVEELFLDLGKRSGVEDIENFAAVFYTAKRTGGDMTQVLQKVARMLGDKIEVKKEIEATLATKKAEQMVMSIMPAGIICYLKLTSPGFLDVLYGNPFGICAMTVCMGIYGLSYWLGVKIVDIEV